MLQAHETYKKSVGYKLSGAVLILAQLIACRPTVESEGGPMHNGEGGAGGRIDNGEGGAGGRIDNGEGGAGGTTGETISACECLVPYGGSSLGDVALTKLRDGGIPACFHVGDPAVLDMERACLPSIVGQHVGDGRDIEVYYFCSDLCPDAGHVGIRFAGIKDPPECCAIGGIPLHDPAWGGFEACVPSEIAPMVPWAGTCP